MPVCISLFKVRNVPYGISLMPFNARKEYPMSLLQVVLIRFNLSRDLYCYTSLC